MLCRFNDHVRINESHSLSELREQNPCGHSWKRWSDYFRNLGYSFLGTIYIGSGRQCKAFSQYLPEDLLRKARTIVRGMKIDTMIPKYVRYLPPVKCPPVKFYRGDPVMFRKVLDKGLTDVCTTCITRKGFIYWVFWNDSERYFYYLYPGEPNGPANRYDVAELWIRVKTSSLDEVMGEVDEIYNAHQERKENHRRKQQELEAQKSLKDKKFYQWMCISDNEIIPMYGESPGNFEKTHRKDLPERCLKALELYDRHEFDPGVFIYKTADHWFKPKITEPGVYVLENGGLYGYVYDPKEDE